MCFSSFSRRSWVNAIESVKRKLEDNDTVEADEANDPSNPFSKRGEKKNKKGKSKVVSIILTNFFSQNIKNLNLQKNSSNGKEICTT